MKRVYLCGPVTGMPNRNQDAFEEAAKKLEAAGYRVSVPTRIVAPSTAHADAMKICMAELLRCGGVCTLEGVGQSSGAQVEMAVAAACGMPVEPLGWWVMDMGGDGE